MNIVNIPQVKGTVPKHLDICNNFGNFSNIQHFYLLFSQVPCSLPSFLASYIILMPLVCLIGLESLCLVQLKADWRMESCNLWRVPSLLSVHQSARLPGLDVSWTDRWEANRLILYPFRKGNLLLLLNTVDSESTIMFNLLGKCCACVMMFLPRHHSQSSSVSVKIHKKRVPPLLLTWVLPFSGRPPCGIGSWESTLGPESSLELKYDHVLLVRCLINATLYIDLEILCPSVLGASVVFNKVEARGLFRLPVTESMLHTHQRSSSKGSIFA